MAEKKKSVREIALDKERKIMETVAWRAGYYRANPQRMVNDALFDKHDFTLRWFQKIILWMMMHYNYLMYLAARGQGKTLLIALFCVIRCILYPGTKIVVTSGTLKQANEVLLKIQDEFMPKSIFLRSEISKCNIGQNDATIMFENTSWIKTRTSNQNSRSARANCLIADEFRMIDETVMNTVLRKFLSAPRQPGYLNKEEYKHLQERNFEAYLSSAFFKSSWGFKKAQDYTLNFFDDKRKYMILGLPYQISIKEGLLMRSQVEDEMAEVSFNELYQAMEMECLFIGDDGDNLFKYDEIDKRRKIKNALYPLKFYDDKHRIPDPPTIGKRILSVDVALMKSTKRKKNDAAAIYINDAIQADNTSYQSNIIYGETFEGLTTDELGIIVMRYYYKYKCTDLVVDTNGIGLGVYDFICKDQYDSETGLVYKALCCCNDEEMAVRCKVKDAEKVVWSVKATGTFNNEICVLLRNGIQNGKINFLISEQACEDEITKSYKPYSKLSPTDQAYIKMPYLQTTMAEYELIKLDHEIKNGNIKVKEQSGMRKDRYSSIAYNYWCACQLELKLRPKQSTNNIMKYISITPPRRSSTYN